MGRNGSGIVRVRGDMDLSDSFTWTEYLEKTGGKPADHKCFKQSRTPPTNSFVIDALLEAEDQRIAITETPPLPEGSYSTPLAVVSTSASVRRRQRGLFNLVSSPTAANTHSPSTAATSDVAAVRRFRTATLSLARVIETSGPRIRVRLVGTDNRNDCWFLIDSDQIRPFPSGEALQPPFGYVQDHLTWHKTLKKTSEEGFPADPSWFAKPPDDPVANIFKECDKLEAVDRRNAQLICPATIGAVSGQLVLISFDGWSGAFDYWTRFDSRDLFPVGWCKRAGYPLQSPGPQATRRLNLSTFSPPSKPIKLAKQASSNTANPLIKRRRSTLSKRRPVTSATRRRRASLAAVPTKAMSIPKLTVFTGNTPPPPLKTIIKMESSTSSSSGGFSSPPIIHPEVMDEDVDEEGRPEPRRSPSSLIVMPPSHYQDLSVEATRAYSEERKRKRSKKHKRHSSKEHRRSSKEHLTVSSVPDYTQPTKLVIRQRSGELLLASTPIDSDTTQKLFINTKPYHNHDNHPIYNYDDGEYHSRKPTQPLVIKCPAAIIQPSAALESEDVADGSTPSSSVSRHHPQSHRSGEYSVAHPSNARVASSTASPSSMDLGPCPLPSPASWTVDDVYNYLISKDISLKDVAAKFKDHEFDGQALLLLTMESLRDFVGLKLGPSLKLDNIISHLKRGQL